MPIDESPYSVVVPNVRSEGQTGAPIGLLVIAGVLIPAVLAFTTATYNPLQVLAVLCGIVAAVVIFARPFTGLLLFIALVYVRPEDVFPALEGMQLTLMVSVVTLVGGWIQLFLKRDPIVRTPLNGLLIGFLITAMASTIGHGNPVDAATDVSKLVILILLILNLVRSQRRYALFTGAIILLTSYVGARGVYLFLTDSTFVHSGDVLRAQGTGVFANPNDLAVAMMPGIALAVGRLRRAGFWARLYYILATVPMIWAVFLTGSRGGTVGLLVILVGTFLGANRNKVKGLLLAGVTCLLLLTVSSARMTNFDHTEASANSRFGFWENGVSMLVGHPITGVGYNQFENMNDGMNAHNTFVICFAELGVIGYFFWIGCLYYCFRRPTQADEETLSEAATGGELTATRVALVSYLSVAFFGNYAYVPITYIVISLPILQQLVVSGRPVQFLFTPQERFRDNVLIAAICILSILFIRTFAQLMV